MSADPELASPAVRRGPLAETSVLLVEDEPLISLLAQDMLGELGCVTFWHAADVASARELLADRHPDIALLDVNLGGESVFPLAERLADLGIPFVFATAYGPQGIPSRWSDIPVITKPYDLASFAAALQALPA